MDHRIWTISYDGPYCMENQPLKESAQFHFLFHKYKNRKMNLFFLGCLMRKRLYWKPDWNWPSWIRKHGIKSAPQFKLQAWPPWVLEKVKPIEQDWIFEVYRFEIFPSITLYFEPPWLPYLVFKVIISRNIKSEIFCIMIFLCNWIF